MLMTKRLVQKSLTSKITTLENPQKKYKTTQLLHEYSTIRIIISIHSITTHSTKRIEIYSSLALEFQVESTVKSTGEPEVIRKRDQFKNAWQELADMTLDVEDETDNNNPQQSHGPTEFHTKFHLFPKLPLDIR
ncbi:hypothetical protein BPAE_0120g00060 [Botrytis paeoniae]|uniref:Uncharacterized protein n=1 Tax=Botrytis paeoniae TaxID=278948 RepID=A0A4Z1FKC2_9HELO|nr:hypothetical protein BPAE_0120g00060 [Botrytis paeoniae]